MAGESEPDIIENKTEGYYDPEEQAYYYIEEDVVRAGVSDSYIAKSAISLREGKMYNRILMYAKDSPNYMGTYTIYTDSYGNRISESKYSDTDRYFEGCTGAFQKQAVLAVFCTHDYSRRIGAGHESVGIGENAEGRYRNVCTYGARRRHRMRRRPDHSRICGRAFFRQFEIRIVCRNPFSNRTIDMRSDL